MNFDCIEIKNLKRQSYESVLKQMQDFTFNRTDKTLDQIWLVEHDPVFTQGRHGKSEHILNTENIPVIQTDRGGQVTYHGPGQAVIYFLIDLKRNKMGIKNLVCLIEKSAIQMLKEIGIDSHLKDHAPGVYVDDKKICSLGLRVKNGRTYHGLSINVNMDLSPFKMINPCGFQNLEMTQIKAFDPNVTLEAIFDRYSNTFTTLFKKSINAKLGVDSCLS